MRRRRLSMQRGSVGGIEGRVWAIEFSRDPDFEQARNTVRKMPLAPLSKS